MRRAGGGVSWDEGARRLGRAAGLLALAGLTGVLGAGAPPGVHAAGPLDRITHFIVIFQENRSFDSLYGSFPGANGLANAGAAVRQVDKDGRPYDTLPQPIDTNLDPPGPDPRFPPDLPVAPFDLSRYVPPTARHGDPVHRFYQEQYQINGGRMDRFVAWTNVGGLIMGHYDATRMPEGVLAREYTLADNFFHAAFGGSYLNHMWLVCACTPVFPDAPAGIVARLGEDGVMVEDGIVTPDGYAVNTVYTVNTPHPAGTAPDELLPNQTFPTIGDRLSEAGVSWAWYSGGWDDAVAGRPDPLFQFHHQPLAYFARYADGTPGRAQHLKDERDFLQALRTRTLPAVSFVKPLGPDTQHPGYADVARGQQHVAELVQAVKDSPYWGTTAIVITYDENGGFWDHVAPPPPKDRWGPGSRIPTIVVSPFARKGYIDRTEYDTTSVLKTIEVRWGLAPLGTRDAGATDLRNAFEPAGVALPRTGVAGGAAPDGAPRASRLLGEGAAALLLGGALPLALLLRHLAGGRRGTP